jgi:hypothetical protein
MLQYNINSNFVYHILKTYISSVGIWSGINNKAMVECCSQTERSLGGHDEQNTAAIIRDRNPKRCE